MRSLASLVLFVLAGITTSIVVAMIVGAFAPPCGLDCESRDASYAINSAFGTVLAFPVLGYLLTCRKTPSTRRILVVLAVLIGSAILAATCRYVVELHARYIEAEAARPVVPDFDFMYMAITTRDVQTYTKAEGGVTKPVSVVPQWQRCVIDGAWCDKEPRQAHMLCKGGVVYVNEADWRAFSLIPQENLYGAVAMRSMNLCAPDNRPE